MTEKCSPVAMRTAMLFLLSLSSLSVVLGAETPISRPVAMAADETTLVFAGGNAVHAVPHRALGRLTEESPKLGSPAVMGGELVDITRVDETLFVAADAAARELVGMKVSGTEVELRFRCPLDLTPAEVRAGLDGKSLCVSGTWDRAIQIAHLNNFADGAEPRTRIPLRFEPKSILALPENRFLIADAFGGHLALLDANSLSVIATQRLHGHQIGDMMLSEDGTHVWVPHQTLSSVARTDRDDIHWGSLIENVVSKLPVASLEQSKTEFHKSIRTQRIGIPGHGFADPIGFVADDTRHAVLSMGARQVLLTTKSGEKHRVPTGRRPTQLLAISQDRLVVLNEQDGSFTIIRWGFPELRTTVTITDQSIPSQGEIAFFDANLSHDNWMSCNSCHVQAHTPALLADTRGDESFATPKRIPSLLSAGDTHPYGWIGNRPSLESQIDATLASTMHARQIPDGTSQALTDYIRNLQPPATTSTQVTPERNSSIDQGKRLFASLRCIECHPAPTFTSAQSKNVGLSDEKGQNQFNPPSLRGVRFRRSFFHDGRADSLREVLNVYQHQLPRTLTAEESRWLTTYLNSL